MEEALKKSEEKFAKAFKSNPAAIIISELVSKAILDVNETFEKTTGYQRAEVVGHGWAEVDWWQTPDDRDKMLTLLRAKGKLRNWEFAFRKKNGTVCSGLLSAELLELEGKPCVITSFTD